jgi:hypothetical protein
VARAALRPVAEAVVAAAEVPDVLWWTEPTPGGAADLVRAWRADTLDDERSAAAADWDAVHVTVAGYLAAAGIAMPAGNGARTMMAGWDPDATWWINDVISFAGPPRDWRKDDQAPLGWTQAQRL